MGCEGRWSYANDPTLGTGAFKNIKNNQHKKSPEKLPRRILAASDVIGEEMHRHVSIQMHVCGQICLGLQSGRNLSSVELIRTLGNVEMYVCEKAFLKLLSKVSFVEPGR